MRVQSLVERAEYQDVAGWGESGDGAHPGSDPVGPTVDQDVTFAGEHVGIFGAKVSCAVRFAGQHRDKVLDGQDGHRVDSRGRCVFAYLANGPGSAQQLDV